MWDQSFGDGGGGGWGGDGSFLTPHAALDSTQQRQADKLPFPVTVEKLASATCNDDKYTIGNIGFSQILLYGCVESIQEQEGGSSIRITLSDPDFSEYTVPVNVLRTFSTNDEDVNYAEGTLVSLLGKLRHSGGETTVLVLKSREVTNKREYDCFKLEAQIAQIYFEKDIGDAVRNNRNLDALRGTPLAPKENIGQPNNATNSNQTSSTVYANSGRPQQQAAPFSVHVNNAQSKQVSNASPRERVLEFLKQESGISGENGVHLDRVAKGTNLPIEEARKLLDYLTGEGEAFQTIDNDHYAVF